MKLVSLNHSRRSIKTQMSITNQAAPLLIQNVQFLYPRITVFVVSGHYKAQPLNQKFMGHQLFVSGCGFGGPISF